MDATMNAEDLIRDNIGTEALIDYLTSDSGDWFLVWSDGTHSTCGGSEWPMTDDDLTIIAATRCPGVGNLDMTWWRQGWECDGLSDEEVIEDCCRNGEVSDEIEGLVSRLIDSLDS